MRQAHQQRMKWVGTRNQDLLSANQRTVITKMLKAFSFIIFLRTFIILSVVANTMSRVNVFGDMCLWTGKPVTKYHEHQHCCLSNSHTFSNRKKKTC